MADAAEYLKIKQDTECFGDGWDGSPSGDQECQGCHASSKCLEHFSLVTLPAALNSLGGQNDIPTIQNYFATRPDPLDFELSSESVEQAVTYMQVHAPGIAPMPPELVAVPVQETGEDYVMPNFGGDDDELPSFAALSDDYSPPSLTAEAEPAFSPVQTQVVVETKIEPPPEPLAGGGPQVNFTEAGSASRAAGPAKTSTKEPCAQNATAQVLRQVVAQKRGRGRPPGSKKPLSQLKNERYRRDRMRQDNQWEPWGPQTYQARWKQEREKYLFLSRLPIGTVIRRHYRDQTFKATLREGHWEFSHPSQPNQVTRHPTLSSVTKAITGHWQGPRWWKIEEAREAPVKQLIMERLKGK